MSHNNHCNYYKHLPAEVSKMVAKWTDWFNLWAANFLQNFSKKDFSVTLMVFGIINHHWLSLYEKEQLGPESGFPPRGHLKTYSADIISVCLPPPWSPCFSLSLSFSLAPVCLILIFPSLCCIVSPFPLKRRLLVYTLAVFTLSRSSKETSFCVFCYVLRHPFSEPHFYSTITFPSFIFTILYHLCKCHGSYGAAHVLQCFNWHICAGRALWLLYCNVSHMAGEVRE